MSKGSNQRPQQVTAKTFAANWDRIFSNNIGEKDVSQNEEKKERQ